VRELNKTQLKKRRLGKTGLMVAELGLGAMDTPQSPEGAATLEAALDLGIDFVDTARDYEGSEFLIGQVVRARGRKDFHLATKTFSHTVDGSQRDVDKSLSMLGVERIDLYQLHRIDPAVPMAEQLGVLTDLQGEGKIRHLGLSEVDHATLHDAREHATIVSVQNRYNLLERDSDAVVDVCDADGIAFLPWFPVAVGELARPGGPLDELAREADATPSQLALAWLLARSPVMLPIPGTSSIDHLEENVAAGGLTLSDEHLARLDALAGGADGS
jgi:pyridoxine 4-dehydrogenase